MNNLVPEKSDVFTIEQKVLEPFIAMQTKSKGNKSDLKHLIGIQAAEKGTLSKAKNRSSCLCDVVKVLVILLVISTTAAVAVLGIRVFQQQDLIQELSMNNTEIRGLLQETLDSLTSETTTDPNNDEELLSAQLQRQIERLGSEIAVNSDLLVRWKSEVDARILALIDEHNTSLQQFEQDVSARLEVINRNFSRLQQTLEAQMNSLISVASSEIQQNLEARLDASIANLKVETSETIELVVSQGKDDHSNFRSNMTTEFQLFNTSIARLELGYEQKLSNLASELKSRLETDVQNLRVDFEENSKSIKSKFSEDLRVVGDNSLSKSSEQKLESDIRQVSGRIDGLTGQITKMQNEITSKYDSLSKSIEIVWQAAQQNKAKATNSGFDLSQIDWNRLAHLVCTVAVQNANDLRDYPGCKQYVGDNFVDVSRNSYGRDHRGGYGYHG